MNESKTKAIEICKNLTHTINHITKSPTQVESVKMMEFSTKPKLSILKRKKKDLMEQHSLTEKDLK
jgi:hypothetical protein